MSGRTVWWPKDAAWWRRNRISKVGVEFGPIAPAILDWLVCEAKVQASGPRDEEGWVKAGYAAIAHGATFGHATPDDHVRPVVAALVREGLLDDFEEAAGEFTCRISGWRDDIYLTLEAARSASKRAGKNGSGKPDPAGDGAGSTGDKPHDDPDRPAGSPTGQDRTGQTSSLREDVHTAGARGESSSGSGPALTVVESAKVKHRGKVVPAERLALAEAMLADFNAQAGTGYRAFKAGGQPSENLSRVLTAVADYPAITAEIAHRMVAAQLAGDHWWKPKAFHLGHVFGPGVVEGLLQQATNPAAATDGHRPALPRNPKYDHIGRKSA